MVFEAFPLVFETETLGSEAKIMAAGPETLVAVTGSTVFVFRKKAGVAATMDCGMTTKAFVMHPVVSMSATTVIALKKMEPVAATMVCKVLSVVYLISGQSIMHLRLVVW